MTPVLLPDRSTSLVTSDPIEDATRREFITGVGAAALAAAFLAACGEDEAEETPAATPEATTRTIDTPMGPVEIPAAPQRVVAIDPYSGLQILDELGAPLVAAGALTGGVRTLVSDAAQALPVVGIVTELDLEAILAAEPDLIMGEQQFGEEIYTQLSEIAPTVLVTASGAGWRDIYRFIADAAGLADRVEGPFAELEGRIAELEEAIASAWPDGVTVTVLRVREPNFKSVRSYTSFAHDFISSATLSELDGVTVTGDRLAEAGAVNADVSAERLRDVDADVILYYLGGGGESDAEAAAIEQSLTSHSLWPSLSAVAAGRAHRVDAAPWFQGRDLEAANLILDDLFKYLVG